MCRFRTVCTCDLAVVHLLPRQLQCVQFGPEREDRALTGGATMPRRASLTSWDASQCCPPRFSSRKCCRGPRPTRGSGTYHLSRVSRLSESIPVAATTLWKNVVCRGERASRGSTSAACSSRLAQLQRRAADTYLERNAHRPSTSRTRSNTDASPRWSSRSENSPNLCFVYASISTSE